VKSTSRVALFSLLLGLGLPIFLQSAASADTNCTILYLTETTTRYCQIDTAVPGAHFEGVTSWNFEDSKVAPKQGFISGKITDPVADGHCATVKVTWQDAAGTPMTWFTVAQACGPGDTAGVDVTLEQGGQAWENARSGIYKLWECSPTDDCTRLWKQDIEATSP
jgi:hypothetical protein